MNAKSSVKKSAVKNMIEVKKIEIGVKKPKEIADEFFKDLKKAVDGKDLPKKEGLYFESVATANRFLTPERLTLLGAIRHLHPKSLYALARITKRPLKSINRDIITLRELGLVEVRKTLQGRKRTMPVVDYDRISIGIEI